ncbi:MAG: hypothetical protein IJU68_06835 [Bacteroidales bacterium]|nr:hypothetical protein [Bacteroidales bacterium]
MDSKIKFTVTLALLLPVLAGAQAKVKEVVTSDYNRNSISFIAVQRGDVYDSDVLAAVKAYNPGEKFDLNKIATETIQVSRSRAVSSQSPTYNYIIPTDVISSAVREKSLDKEILTYIFGRDSQGFMNDKLIRYRGNYDAKDQDVINARASRVGIEALGDAGHGLVSHSYVVVVDPYSLQKKVDDKGKVTWSASTKAYAYKLGLSAEQLNEFYDKCWIYEEDDDATKTAKRQAFIDFPPLMEQAAVVSASGSSSDPKKAIYNSLSDIVTHLENQLSDWEVAVTIAAKKPLRAKIGTKEGLRNGARYRAYSYREDEAGNLISVPRGYLRATEISDNSGMASGETEPSKFYQISGMANIEEGWTIKQSNDLKFGVMAGVKFGGICPGASLAIDMDLLMNVNTNGTMSYVLLGGAFDLKTASGVSAVNFGIGYGYAFHLSRFIELMPYISLINDYVGPVSSGTSSTASFMSKSALALEPGFRASVNVAYPLQLFGKVCFDWLTPLRGNTYELWNNSANHGSRLGFQAGVKWTF